MRRRSDEDFLREIESHIAIETDRLISEGLPPDEARVAAERRFGNVTGVRERFYESSRVLWLDRIRHDVRVAVRTLSRSPMFTAIAAAMLAIGIGATTAVATQINAIFFQPLPVTEPSTLRTLTWSSYRRAFASPLFGGDTWDARLKGGEGIGSFPHSVFNAVKDRTTRFSGVACWRAASEVLDENGHVRVHAVSGNFFDVIGVRVVAGRSLTEDDDRADAPLVALTHDRRQLNQRIRIHGHLFEVVGILPDDFGGLTPTEPANVIVPYAADHLFPIFQRNDWAECRIVVRLKDGATWDAARAEAEVIVAQEIQANPPRDAYDAPAVQVDELSTYFSDLQRSVTTPISVLSATVALLLLITCANVGGLLFARGRARQKEIATRLALGGARRRVMQQLITESLVLCLTGGVAGVALAYAFNPLLPRFVGQLGGTTLGVAVRPDLGVLAFAVVVTLTCGVLFGWLPALMATRVDPALSIKQASGLAPPSRLRAGKVALAIQLALSLIVLVAAGLLVRTMTNLRAVPLGYTPDGMVFVLTSNPVGRPRAFVEQTLAELEALPAVRSATVSQWPIFNNTTLRAQFCIPGGDPAVERIDLSYVFPRFFETWGVRLLRGHDIPDRGEPVAVVNETFARRFFPGQDPIGRVFMSGPCPGRTPLRIIGVAEDHIDRQRAELVPAVYLRYPLAGALYVTTYALRTNGDERALLPALRRIIAERGIAPDGDARTGIEYREGIVARERVMMLVLVALAAVSLFISCLGVYGMLAYTVSWRTPEIGLRMAVGAARPHVLWLIVRESLMPVALGAALGIATSVAFSRVVESLLFGVTANDPIAVTVAVAMLVMAAGAAAGLAAWRACRVEPVRALRCD